MGSSQGKKQKHHKYTQKGKQRRTGVTPHGLPPESVSILATTSPDPGEGAMARALIGQVTV